MTSRGLPAQIGDLPPIDRPANSALLAAGITTLAGVAALGRRRLSGMHRMGPNAVLLLDAALAGAGAGLAFAD